MKIVSSVSGGKTSAYIAANYKSDALVFALVRTEDKQCRFKDRALARKVERRIDKEFNGTLEDDTIIHTMFDLEQHLGKKIHWVSGLTFEKVLETKGGWLPSIHRRYCTTWLKIDPIFHWWHEYFNAEPVKMNIGYRCTEVSRAKTMIESLNEDNLSVYKATFERHTKGRHKGLNKWVNIAWRMPQFPLIEDGIDKVDIENFWKDKLIRFAELNNCVGCFHRPAALLKQQSIEQPNKFQWFANQEGKGKGTWKKNISYNYISKLNFTQNLFESEGCNSGFCGM
ncbi:MULTISPECIES: hypothetical protein [unclassified Aureispira]|uniref:hypothetical protein n=1 Tax=unclassified Aureispira TaxID=2649989 RepID=UPI000698FDB8|nr:MULTISPECIES: hypothetical protein [unclassified Aureispira]WMX12415.1 hypothetical protein QP953_16420 [Aureispira sp. CCB-E]